MKIWKLPRIRSSHKIKSIKDSKLDFIQSFVIFHLKISLPTLPWLFQVKFRGIACNIMLHIQCSGVFSTGATGAIAPVILRKRLIAPAVSTRNGKTLLTLSTLNIKILNTPLSIHTWALSFWPRTYNTEVVLIWALFSFCAMI